MDILPVFLELMTSSASQRLNILCIYFKIMTFNIAAHLRVDVRIGILLEKMFYDKLHRKPKIEQDEPHSNSG
jgi:hypothetical protein